MVDFSIFDISITKTLLDFKIVCWQVARSTEWKYACEYVFACVYGWECVYKYGGLYSQNSNSPKSSGWCWVPKLGFTGFQNSFHDSLIELLEVHVYNDRFLTSNLLFIIFHTHFYRHYSFDWFNQTWLSSHFSKYELKRQNFL